MLRIVCKIWPTVAVIVVLLMLAVASVAMADGYTPMTVDQAKAYMAAHPDSAVQDIIRLDYLEHVQPQGTIPPMTALLRGRDLVLAWDPPYATVLLPDIVTSEGKLPGMQFNVTLATITEKDFAPPTGRELIPRLFEDLLCAGAGALIYAILK